MRREGEELETSMDGGVTDVLERMMSVSNNRDRTGQFELELVVPEISGDPVNLADKVEEVGGRGRNSRTRSGSLRDVIPTAGHPSLLGS